MASQLSQGWCKIDGHNLPKSRIGFQKANDLQKSKASKNARFQKEIDSKRRAEIRQDLNTRFLLSRKQRVNKKIIQAINFFIVLSGIVGLSLYFFHSINNYESAIQTGSQEMIVTWEGEKGKSYLRFIHEGTQALERNELKKATEHFKKAENLFPNGKQGLEGLAISFTRQCLEEGVNCNKASDWLKHAWTKCPEKKDLLVYLRAVNDSQT